MVGTYLDVVVLDLVGDFLAVLLDDLGLVLVLETEGEVLNDLVLLLLLSLGGLLVCTSFASHRLQLIFIARSITPNLPSRPIDPTAC